VRVPYAPGGGVQAGQITTPAGSASFRLPEAVATKRDLDQTTQTLQAAINSERTRLNNTQKDLETLTQRVAVVVSDTAKDVQKVRADLVRSRRAQAAAMARWRREQASAQQTSMMMTMFLQRQIQDDLESHTHSLSHDHPVLEAGAGKVSGDSSVKSTEALESSDDNSLLFLLPMMMGQPQGGGGGGDQQGMDMSSMMMMMLALK
jgi:hypothetical protein